MNSSSSLSPFDAVALLLTILPAWIGQMMMHTGITKKMIQTAAELGGDRAFVVTLSLALVTALINTVMTGLGSAIMVGSIVLPIMITLGVTPLVAGCIFLASQGVGVVLSLSSWNFFATVTGVQMEDVKVLAFSLSGMLAVAVVIFAVVEFKRNGIKFACAQKASPAVEAEESGGLRVTFLGILTPFVPIVLVIALKMPVNTAIAAGLVYCVLVTILTNLGQLKRVIGLLSQSGVEGITNSASAILILLGIGMILNALTHPTVMAQLNPLLAAIIPHGMVMYIIFFIIVAPLSLYRGPMNMWGLGSGLAAVMIGLGTLPANAVFGAFLSSRVIQCTADPTNSFNVWVANFIGCDVNQIMLKLLPYLLGVSSLSVILSAILYL